MAGSSTISAPSKLSPKNALGLISVPPFGKLTIFTCEEIAGNDLKLILAMEVEALATKLNNEPEDTTSPVPKIL